MSPYKKSRSNDWSSGFNIWYGVGQWLELEFGKKSVYKTTKFIVQGGTKVNRPI